MEQHDVPVISVSALIPGAINDKDKSGLASLTATALKHGTKNFTKAKLDEDLDFIGANVALMLEGILGLSSLQLKIKTTLLLKYCSTLFLTQFEKRKAGYWLGWSSKRKSTICHRSLL
jgi:hypothetical protein